MRWKKVTPRRGRGVQTQPVQTAYIPEEDDGSRYSAVRIAAACALVLFGVIGIVAWFTDEGALMHGFRVIAGGLLGWGFYLLPLCLLLAAYWLGLHRDRPCARRVACTIVLAALFGVFVHLGSCRDDSLLKLGTLKDTSVVDVVRSFWKAGCDPATHCGGVVSGFAAALLYTCLRRVFGMILLSLGSAVVLLNAFGGSIRGIVTGVSGLREKLREQAEAAQQAREQKAAEAAARAEEAAARAEEEAAARAEEEAAALAREQAEAAARPAAEKRSLFDEDSDLADLLSDDYSAPAAQEEPAAEAVTAETPAEEAVAEEVPVEETPVDEVPAEEAIIEEAPVEEAPAEEVPVEETPVEETPADETPIEEAPVEEVSAEEAPAEETPVEEVPAEETPVEEVPVEEAPVEAAPVEDAPGEGTPVGESASVLTAPPSAEEAGFVRLNTVRPEDILSALENEPETATGPESEPKPEPVPESVSGIDFTPETEPEQEPAPAPEPEPEPDTAELLMQSMRRHSPAGVGKRRMYDEEWEEKKDLLFTDDLLGDDEKPAAPAKAAAPVSQDETAAAEPEKEEKQGEENEEEKTDDRKPARSGSRFQFIIMSNDPKPVPPPRPTAQEIWDELE